MPPLDYDDRPLGVRNDIVLWYENILEKSFVRL
jgi:hypothetical protein